MAPVATISMVFSSDGMDRLTLKSLDDANISLGTHANKEIVVTLTGTQGDLDQIEVGRDGSEIKVSLKPSTGGSVFTGKMFTGSMYITGSINFGDIKIGGFESKVSIEILVPEGFPLNLVGSFSELIDMSELNGPLMGSITGKTVVLAERLASVTLKLSSECSLNAGSATNVNLSLGGQSTVLITSIDGVVTANLGGSTHFVVKGGSSPQVTINANGNATVKIGATVDKATIDASGKCRVEFTLPVAISAKKLSGSARVIIP